MNKKNSSPLLSGIILGLLVLILPLVVKAAPPTTLTGLTLTMGKIASLIDNFKNWFAGIVLIVGVAIILYAGVLYMTAAGDEERSKRAKTTLIGGLTGVAVALLAYGVFTAIKSFLQ